jgi:hypothetical protein
MLKVAILLLMKIVKQLSKSNFSVIYGYICGYAHHQQYPHHARNPGSAIEAR